MKNLFLLVTLLTTVMLSCQNKQTGQKNISYLILSGTAKNFPKDSLTLLDFSDRNFSLSFQLAEDGTFKDTVNIKEGDYYFFTQTLNTVYLANGMDLSISFDYNGGHVALSGVGAEVNEYHKAKEVRKEKISSNNLTPSEYKKETAKLKEINLKEIAKVTDVSTSKIEQEKRFIQYNYLYGLVLHKKIEERQGTYTASNYPKDYLAEINELQLDNELDFGQEASMSNVYRRLLLAYYEIKAKEKSRDDYKAFFKQLGTNPNQHIKNAIAYRKAYDIAHNSKGFKEVDDFIKVFNSISNNEEDKETIANICKTANSLYPGDPSPVFTDYENYHGGRTSLSDFKGKYVYIDVWATWCGPCIKEIPYLADIEEEYHGKNIAFVSISIDVSKNHDKWKKMIADKNMDKTGAQLLANNAKSNFQQDYLITSIPYFVLIDPEGNIVTANAPKPSDKEEITKLFDSLSI